MINIALSVASRNADIMCAIKILHMSLEGPMKNKKVKGQDNIHIIKTVQSVRQIMERKDEKITAGKKLISGWVIKARKRNN